MARESQVERLKLEEHFENLPLLAYNIATDGTIINCNRQVVETLGYRSKQELLGKPLLTTVYAPSSQEKAKRLLREWRRTGKIRNEELQVITKRGSLIDVLLNVDTICDAKGRPLYSISTQLDISERKRMEGAYRTIVEYGLQGIAILQDNHVVFANQALLEMSGHSRGEILSLSPNAVKDVVHPEDRERVWQDMQNRMAGKPAPTRQEFRFIRKDGAIRWVEALPSRVDYQGKPAVQVAYADITERRQAEDQMARQHAVLNAINRVFTGALTCETEDELARTCLAVAEELTGSVGGFIGELNQAGRMDTIAISSLGWNVCKMPGSQATRLVRGMELRGIWARVFKDQKSLIVNDPRSHPDSIGTPEGHPTLRSFLGIPLKHAERTFGIVALANKLQGYDISDKETLETLSVAIVEALMRKRAEEALQESEEKYRKLFEEARDGIALADPDTGILLDCNQALAALVGRNRAELIGQHQAILHPPSSEENEPSPTFKLHTTTHEGQVLETQVITATGEIREVEIKAGLLYLRGRKTLQGIFSDITERKRTEEATRRRAEELAALQATVLDITGRHKLAALLETIVERATRLLRVSSGGMYLCDPQKREARCVVAYRTPYDLRGTMLKYGEGAAGTIAETGKPLIVDDYRTWKGRADAYEQTKPFIAVLGVPVIWQGQVTGVIDVLDDRPQHFTKADQELLTLFANHAAIAIENARLIEQEKYHAEELAHYSTSLEQLVLERTGKLAESERRFRELADLLPQIVFEIDDKGNLLFANRITFATTGYTEDDLHSGLNAFQMLTPEDHDRLRQNMARSLGGEKLGANEYTIRRKDGSTFLAMVNTAPIMRGKKTVGLRGVVVDITERKRMEVELRSAKERLDYVITSNPAVIFTAKPRADHSDYDMAYMSESVVSMLAFEPQQFIGHPEFWDAHIHPDDLRRYPIEIPELWKKGQHTFEYRFLHKDGDYRWIREEAKVVCDADGVPTEVIGYWTDITERKQMEAELAKSQRLATIGEIAAMVGHDLRNPLQAIVSTAYLAKKNLESLPEPSTELAVKSGLANMLETIENESEYMNKIVYDLQDYSAPLKPEPTQVDVESLVKETLSKMRIPQNVQVSIKISEAFPRVMIDPSVVRRILTNLTLNAIQAMPEGGELGVEMTRRDRDLLIAFKDTGVGIAEEDMDKLFNPFFTTKAKGQGLGLAVCKRLAEAHCGRITVESRLGEGSTFTIKLPIVKS